MLDLREWLCERADRRRIGGNGRDRDFDHLTEAFQAGCRFTELLGTVGPLSSRLETRNGAPHLLSPGQRRPSSSRRQRLGQKVLRHKEYGAFVGESTDSTSVDHEDHEWTRVYVKRGCETTSVRRNSW